MAAMRTAVTTAFVVIALQLCTCASHSHDTEPANVQAARAHAPEATKANAPSQDADVLQPTGSPQIADVASPTTPTTPIQPGATPTQQLPDTDAHSTHATSNVDANTPGSVDSKAPTSETVAPAAEPPELPQPHHPQTTKAHTYEHEQREAQAKRLRSLKTAFSARRVCFWSELFTAAAPEFVDDDNSSSKARVVFDPIVLPATHHCESVYLKDVALGDAGVRGLAAYLVNYNSRTRQRNIQNLQLAGTNMGPAGALALANALNHATVKVTVGSLWLDNNPLGVAGVEALAGALSVRTDLGLAHLFLDRCHLQPAGAAALLPALAKLGTLQTLSIRSNGIGSVGAAAAGKLLYALPALATLELGDNNVQHTGDRRVCIALLYCCSTCHACTHA